MRASMISRGAAGDEPPPYELGIVSVLRSAPSLRFPEGCAPEVHAEDVAIAELVFHLVGQDRLVAAGAWLAVALTGPHSRGRHIGQEPTSTLCRILSGASGGKGIESLT